jgi:hypothetical protein
VAGDLLKKSPKKENPNPKECLVVWDFGFSFFGL